jgi:hypothetical protein
LEINIKVSTEKNIKLEKLIQALFTEEVKVNVDADDEGGDEEEDTATADDEEVEDMEGSADV